MSGQSVIPFLKWPGGKRWLVQSHSDWLRRGVFRRWIEPFLGGGAAFFHLAPSSAILGDINPDVICAYEGVRTDPHGVLRHLRKHHRNHSADYYYKVRASRPRTPATRAARVIYLNRTCFNGIYRVNLRGVFNVPVGTRSAVVLPTDDFAALAERLKRAEVRLSDFQPVIAEAREGDVVYADPPYTVRHNLNGFVKYNEVLFSWEDQVRLVKCLAAARDRGATVLATNAAHPSIRGLYMAFGFCYKCVGRFSSIAADGESRGEYEELLISSRTRAAEFSTGGEKRA